MKKLTTILVLFLALVGFSQDKIIVKNTIDFEIKIIGDSTIITPKGYIKTYPNPQYFFVHKDSIKDEPEPPKPIDPPIVEPEPEPEVPETETIAIDFNDETGVVKARTWNIENNTAVFDGRRDRQALSLILKTEFKKDSAYTIGFKVSNIASSKQALFSMFLGESQVIPYDDFSTGIHSTTFTFKGNNTNNLVFIARNASGGGSFTLSGITIQKAVKDEPIDNPEPEEPPIEEPEPIDPPDVNPEPTDPPVIDTIIDDFATEIKAFPTAYGGGAYAKGGRGGYVYHVTNLNDSGEGSLRWALAQPRPATVICDVSGIVDIESWLNLSGEYLTFAGQTAPKGGITISSSTYKRIRGRGLKNSIIRYLRIRIPQGGDDAFELWADNGGANDTHETSNNILDHISVSYAGDEAMSIRGRNSFNNTYQNVLIAESKTGSLFGDSSKAHSYDNSFLNSLFFNVSHRHPNTASNGRVDIINNVVHDWQYRLTLARFDVKLNHINNFYSMGLKSGISSRSGATYLNISESQYNQRIYTAGNIVDKGYFEDPNADNRPLWRQKNNTSAQAPDSEFVSSQYPLIGAPVPIKTAKEKIAEIRTKPDVGANAYLNADGSVGYYTDIQDTFYLSIMAKGEGAGHPYDMFDKHRSWMNEEPYLSYFGVTDIGDPDNYRDETFRGVDNTIINKRPDDYDTDRDGMPNVWEELYGTDPNKPDNNGDLDGDGYTNLEEFLNSVDKGK